MRSSLLLLLFLSVAYGDVCPSGYSQGPNGGDCFQVKRFFNSWAGRYDSKNLDQAESECNKDGGGLLASIRSSEDFDAITSVNKCNEFWTNIGLKCKGTDCKWDDGAPVVYTNFRGAGPKDDGKARCYGYDGTRPYGEWQEQSCDQHESDCWVCRVKASKIDCTDGETAYKGGCVSVHSTPLDQKTAEASCPGGGHLVSIHSAGMYTENEFYSKLALAAGVNGTMYIGGEFSSNGVFQWTDGSNHNQDNWANNFPNTIFGTCVQMLLASEFGVQGQWTNIDCTVKQPYMCFRDGSENDPTAAPHPKADAKCPSIQYFTGSGTIFSPNYPLSIPGQQNCEYVLAVPEGAKASIKFDSFDCQSGTALSLFDGLNGIQPFATFTTTPPTLHQSYAATSNVMKMLFSANGTAAPVGTGWEAEFIEI